MHLVSLLPSLEGLIVPSKFYGILAAGRPVVFIGDPDGELARVTCAGQCGTTVRSGHGGELAGALLTLKEHAEQRHAMGLAARRLLTERYSTRRAIDCWVDLLDRTASAAAA